MAWKGALKGKLERAHQSSVQVWCITTKITLEDMTYFQEIPVCFND